MELTLEIIAVALNVVYLILLIKEKIACWFFGIAGSLVSIYLFYSLGLYSESILYIYYVAIGVYGYQQWNKKDDNKLQIRNISIKKNLTIIGFGIIAALLLAYGFDTYTDAVNPYLDAFTTIFSFTASFLEARKIISSWIFWIVINSATVVLYLEQNLYIYIALTLIYIAMSFVGYREWKAKITSNQALEFSENK